MLKLSKRVIQCLTETDTPTICNAIELAQGRRGFNQFTRGQYIPMHQSAQVAMGFARTAQIAAEQPPQRSNIENQQMRLHYYEYMATASKPAICVIEDTDTYPVGAFWGEVNSNIHRGFGLSGTLTNGAIRDLGCCPQDYQIIGGSLSPSHRFVHVQTIDTTVEIFGLRIQPNDFVHADRHGACIIPTDILPEIDHWIAKMQDIEKLVIQPSQQADFDFAKFKLAWQEVEKRRV